MPTSAVAPVALSPLLELMALAAVLAMLPLAWWWWRHRAAGPRARLAALTVLTLFLTFDLVVFGAFTRLTDSGLGCPDWPGCYGESSPVAAHEQITAAERAQPTGPVTRQKAWIEMIHRYLAMTVGLLAFALAGLSAWHRHQLPFSLSWPWATAFWVIVQGLFGRFTVTLKLYPAIVTLHLAGGLFLLALLAVQAQRYANRPLDARHSTHRLLMWGLAALVLQVLLGAWVSTNYAVLACQGFPQCNGQWWPDGMEAAQGFSVFRHLGRTGEGGFLSIQALVAIHWAHRIFAIVVVTTLIGAAVALWRLPGDGGRRPAAALAALLCLQVGTGAANVVLQWPLAAALMHTAGAAALVWLLVTLLARSTPNSSLLFPAGMPAPAAHPASQ